MYGFGDGDGVDVSGALATFLAVAVAVGGTVGWYRHGLPTGVLGGTAMAAVGVLATHRALVRDGSPTDPGALTCVGLFALAAAAKAGGATAALAPLETTGEALFVMALAYFLLR